MIIDPYADAKALGFLLSKRENTKVLLVISSKSKLTQDDVMAFNLQYGGLVVKNDDSFHDRFIIIDNDVLYHLGASLNYAGRKTFAVVKMSDTQLIASIVSRIKPI